MAMHREIAPYSRSLCLSGKALGGRKQGRWRGGCYVVPLTLPSAPQAGKVARSRTSKRSRIRSDASAQSSTLSGDKALLDLNLHLIVLQHPKRDVFHHQGPWAQQRSDTPRINGTIDISSSPKSKLCALKDDIHGWLEAPS
jgi:hypothetical protein